MSWRSKWEAVIFSWLLIALLSCLLFQCNPTTRIEFIKYVNFCLHFYLSTFSFLFLSLWQILHQMIIVRVWYLCYTYLHSPHIWYTHKIEKNMQVDAGVMAGLNQQEVIQGCSITEMSEGERRNLQHRQPRWVSLLGIWHEQNQACYMCMIQQSLSCLGELACRLWSIFVYAALRKAYTLYLFFPFFCKTVFMLTEEVLLFRFWWSMP